MDTCRPANMTRTLALLLLAAAACSAASFRRSGAVTNMNGEYLLSNAHPNGKWDSNYAKFGEVEYIDV